MTERLTFLLTFTWDYYHCYHNDITDRFGEFVLSCKRASHSQISHSQTKLKTFMKLSFWCPELELLSVRPREIKEKSRRFREANWGCLMTTTRITDFFCPLCLHNLMQAETYQGQQEPKESEETGWPKNTRNSDWKAWLSCKSRIKASQPWLKEFTTVKPTVSCLVCHWLTGHLILKYPYRNQQTFQKKGFRCNYLSYRYRQSFVKEPYIYTLFSYLIDCLTVCFTNVFQGLVTCKLSFKDKYFWNYFYPKVTSDS